MSAIDCDVQEYDSRVRMATQLAASADVSAACIGILDWRRHKLVDGWVGQGRSGAKLGAAEVTNLVSKALAIFLSCGVLMTTTAWFWLMSMFAIRFCNV